MKLFSVHFYGHYPIGSAAIVVAEDSVRAYDLAVEMLQKDGLWSEHAHLAADINTPKSFTAAMLEEIPLDKPGAYMLANGNY